MTDKLIDFYGPGIHKRLQDMGDGSFAEVVSVAGGGATGLKVDNTDLIAAINSQTGTLVALDPLGTVENAPAGVTGTLVDIKREADTGAVVGYALFGTNTPYTPVGTLEPFVVTYGSVVVTQSSLPTGAATEASLASIATKLDTIHADLSAENTTITAINAGIGNAITAIDAVATATLAVKASIEGGNVSEATIATQTATLTTTLASIQTLITSGNTALGVLHNDGVDFQALASTGNTALSAIQTALGSEATAANQSLALTALASLNTAATSELTKLDTIASNIVTLGTTLGAGKTLADIVAAINADATPADIVALQSALTTLETAGNASLDSINSKTPALNVDGGALTHITNFPATQPVSGSVSVSNQPTTLAVTQATAGNLNATVVGTGTLAVQNTAAVIGGNSVAVKVDNSGVTQPISGTVSLTSASRTAALATVSTTGSVTAGATEVSFFNSGAASATVAGGSLGAGYGVTFTATKGDTLNAIAYDATGTTIMISTVA